MSRYAVGIDLGTTNCALSYRDFSESADQAQGVSASLRIPQLTAAGTIEERVLLPSFLYLPKKEEFPESALALPWDDRTGFIVGEFARSHGVFVAGTAPEEST